MDDFSESEEFDLTEGAVLTLSREIVSLGWTAQGGTLLVDGRVAPGFRLSGHGVGCRFDRGGDVVGLHVYGHPASPVASLSLPIPQSEHVARLVEVVEEIVGRRIGRDGPG